MSDAEMMRFMAGCMLAEGPAPSVETPLHSLLPHRVIAHTHDVATMSLTNVADGDGRAAGGELFEGGSCTSPTAGPAFRSHARSAHGGPDPAEGAIGMTLAHHGLVVWGDDAEAATTRLCGSSEDRRISPAASRRGRRLSSSASRPVPLRADDRRRLAELVLPAVRGALGTPDRVILHYDDGEDVLAALPRADPELVRRGMATPEHLLRAGRLPVWLDLDLARPTRRSSPVRTPARRGARRVRGIPRRHAATGRAPARRLGQGGAGPRARPHHRVHRQAQRRDRESLLSGHARGHRERRGGGSVRVHPRAGRVRVRALAAGAAEGGGDDRAGARDQGAAAARGGGDRRGERHRPGGGAAVRRGGRARRGGGSGRRTAAERSRPSSRPSSPAA